ncbi:MAG: nucleoside deaminase [Candidatus Liptonbacteria bacterium]|nr:nucleoside deaminase [Candidatus Liptonbacteria bacterium]
MINLKDRELMGLALGQAKKAERWGNYPVGAVLTFNGKVAGKNFNSIKQDSKWAAHAEAMLVIRNSKKIKSALKKNARAEIVLYTTLEPCLMCLGIAFLHRIKRIVYGCPDPRGGATRLSKSSLTEFYRDYWPEIKGGVLKKESYEMLIKFMKRQRKLQWKRNLKLFEEMAGGWK